MKKPKKLNPKELFALVEEYGTSMRELGARDADLMSIERNKVFVKVCKLIAKIEREIGA